MLKVVYPGTFDPFTKGHEDLVRRAAKLFDRVVVGIADSESKRPMFAAAERIAMTQEVLAGTWKGTNVWGGIKDGMIKLAPINAAVPKDVVELVASKEKDIGAGKLHPFTGPLKDNAGKERLAAGQTMGDDKLAVMDFYVEGVQGTLPKQ